MLDYYPELKTNYTLYQGLLLAMTNHDYTALEGILERQNSTLISNYMKTSLKRLR